MDWHAIAKIGENGIESWNSYILPVLLEYNRQRKIEDLQHLKEFHSEVCKYPKRKVNIQCPGSIGGVRVAELSYIPEDDPPTRLSSTMETRPTDDARIYPCIECGKLRTKAEGGTTFSLCEVCWDKEHGKEPERCDHPCHKYPRNPKVEPWPWKVCPMGCSKPLDDKKKESDMGSPGDVIYLEAVMPGGGKAIIGSWVLPDRNLTNFDAQADIGWHIILCLLDGAIEVKVRVDKPKEE